MKRSVCFLLCLFSLNMKLSYHVSAIDKFDADIVAETTQEVLEEEKNPESAKSEPSNQIRKAKKRLRCHKLPLNQSQMVTNVDDAQNLNTEQVSDDVCSSKIINVPYVGQNDIPSGCEAVSATMILQYFGYMISARDFTDNFLIKKDWMMKKGRKIYAADPNSAYPGNPYIAHGYNCGFGCYAPALAKSINNFLNGHNHKAFLTTGTTIKELISNYINNDIPVLIWATMDMKPSRLGSRWIIDYVDENAKYKIGDLFTWIAGEHCLVLVGYDDTNYYFNDPYKNHGFIAYEKSIVEQRFSELGCQSIVLLDKNSSR